MADAAVEFLLQKASTVVTNYANLISGAENDFHQLTDELGMLKTFLQDATKKPKELKLLREIERQIREVVYNVEDAIDTCVTQAAIIKVSRNPFKRNAKKVDVSLPLLVKSLREEKVLPIFKKIEFYKSMEVPEGSGAKAEETGTRVRKSQSIRQDKIVGFEDEEKTIVGFLMEQTKELDVISIIGMPGLGKTTLAWKIFQSQKMQFEFPKRIWVNISQELNRREVLLNILKEFTPQDMPALNDHDLNVAVRKRLEEGKFLLVMDDVWSGETWKQIKDVLPVANMVSKVVLTSRYKDVGTHANPKREPHNLRFLREDESWKLLQLEVFGELDNCPPELNQAGQYTANQCKGLPLALVVIGGILLDLRHETKNFDRINESWLEVANNVTQFVKSNTEYNISEIVEMSYNRLPDGLRDCFLYMGVFPEDYEIPTWTLTRLWIAEGFILHRDGHIPEETAEENLKELIDRNLVMADKVNPDDEVKTCRVHDVVRAFCAVKAEEQNLYQETRMTKGVFQPSVNDIHKYRRLCIHSNVPKFLSKKPKGPHVRSFLSFNKVPVDLEEKLTPVISDCFVLLRVLDSNSIKFMQFPKGVTKLIRLRYITLSIDDLDSLPKAISDLWNLQTIVVETNSQSLKIEGNIRKMIQLRHLKTKAAIVLERGDGDGGENLQTLSRLSPNHCTDEVFEKACNLKTLGIRGDLAILSTGGKSLQQLSLLEKLKLVHDKSTARPLRSLPQGFFLRTLRRMTISATSLDWTHMSTLAMIDSLKILKLKNKAFMGSLWKASSHGFPHLHYLLIEDTDLAVWTASEDYFPALKTLLLRNCEYLVEIPVGATKKLEILDIDRLGKSAVLSAKKIEQDKKKSMQEGLLSKWGGRFKLKIGPSCPQ